MSVLRRKIGTFFEKRKKIKVTEITDKVRGGNLFAALLLIASKIKCKTLSFSYTIEKILWIF